MVGHLPLKQSILVRAQVPQPKNREAIFSREEVLGALRLGLEARLSRF